MKHIQRFWLMFVVYSTISQAAPAPGKPSSLRIIHVNDVHSVLLPIKNDGGVCKKGDQCFGGWARIVGEKNRLAKQDTTPTLFLNAGDDSRGTSFFDTYGMKIIPDYLNAAGIAAWTVGNHDFDNGETELAAAIAKFKFPVLGGNIASQNAILKDKFKPYIVLPNFGVVIMGISTQETAKFSKASPTTVFSNEIASAQKILEEIRVKVLKANPTYKVIALTHIGYEQDLALAKATKGISVIIGGHSHTGMGGMKGQLETDAKLPYPQMVPSADVGQKVCVVQAAYNGRYLGEIIPQWSADNKMTACKGKYHELDNKVQADPTIEKMIQQWPVKDVSQNLGEAMNDINRIGRFGSPTDRAECLMGNFIADSILEATQKQYPAETISFGIGTAGILRRDLAKGPITGEMLAYFFKDPLVKWTLTGKDLSTLLEGIYSKVNTFDPKTPKKMADDVYLHFSKGIKITYDRSPAAKNGSRLKQVLIGGKPLQADVKYTVGMTEWIVLGKEDLYMAVDKTKYKAFSNVVEAMTNYFLKHKKVTVAYEGRQVDSGKYPKQ